ncbi:MAG: hypothetical protein EOO20_25875, partial [Chryseobacterium sp.]
MARNFEHTSTTTDTNKHERQLQSILPFYNTAKRLNDALISAGAVKGHSEVFPQHVHKNDGIDGAYDIERLAVKAKAESESSNEPYVPTDDEKLYLAHMDNVSSRFEAFATIDMKSLRASKFDGEKTQNIDSKMRLIREDLKAKIDAADLDDKKSLEQKMTSLDTCLRLTEMDDEYLSGTEAHDFIVAADYINENPLDAYASLDRDKAARELGKATEYNSILADGYKVIAEYYPRQNEIKPVNSEAAIEGVDEVTAEEPLEDVVDRQDFDNVSKEVRQEFGTERESTQQRAKEQIAKEAIKAVSKEASAEATEAIVSNGDSDIDKDDLFAAIQHDFKDFIPS